MEIGRRGLLAGAASLSLVNLVRLSGPNSSAGEEPAPTDQQWHPLTRSLLDRAGRAGQRLDRPRVERIVHEVSEEHGRPVIKWMESPACAFEHLSRYPLNDLIQMGTAKFWPVPPLFTVTTDDAAERSFELYWHAAQILKAEEHDRALMAPKVIAKRRAIEAQFSSEAIFEVRAVAAQIGWLETLLPAAAAKAVSAIEDLLSAGHGEDSLAIYHQLKVFEACEHGLLATWETPHVLVCVPGFT